MKRWRSGADGCGTRDLEGHRWQRVDPECRAQRASVVDLIWAGWEERCGPARQVKLGTF